MARFHVYRLKQGDTLVIDLQADLFDALKTRMVAPFIPEAEFGRAMSRLNPQVTIDGEHYILATHLMSAISLSVGDMVANLSDRRDDIVAAIDFAFQGF
ncbi:CcdB family protein [Sinorhizobium numidicum]|uniref:Toxin CcdB n=1 Tax=Sinorhizobium numidicum TaxID=680248 RepID=A0ABY8D095_9HYPH|nr:CcdB family protein [Sinorhizobium numidicum]WEX77641.1 CcdB family protein [Sinorhizobium numidicum]WEX84301.1 CcdB family protein [Sinorhizobium numidicum]